MKEKMNQMFRDKLFLVMLVLGLLTMVAAAGVVTIRRGNGQEQKPYVDMQGQDEYFAEEAKDQAPVAENSNAENSGSEITQEERRPETGRIPDLQQMVQRMTGQIRP